MLSNYIPDVNKFQLAGPPTWFLRQLWDFDQSLVIVPSRQGFYYRLAQRRKLQLPENIVNEALWKQSDTRMLASYSLVPVTTILATANWSNPYIFVELANRAPWRQGGASKVNALLDDQEKQDELKRLAQQDDHLTYVAKDAWRYYNLKIGKRTSLYSPTVKPSTASAQVAPAIHIPSQSLPKPDVSTMWGK